MARQTYTIYSPGGFVAYRYSRGRRKGWVRVRKFQSADWPFPQAWRYNDAAVVEDKHLGVRVAERHYRERLGRGWVDG